MVWLQSLYCPFPDNIDGDDDDDAMLSYSPFFTSGLLSEGLFVNDSSYQPFAEGLGSRRGSLPNDMPPSYCGTSQKIQSTSDQSSAFYFTLQPRRDTIALRSFLSLDLAESQSIRSASIRRNDSTMTRSTMLTQKPAPLHQSTSVIQCYVRSWLCTYSGHNYSPHSECLPRRSSIRRASGESLRSIPCPKPVPQAAPPDVPRHTFDGPPVLPPILPSPRFSFMPDLHEISLMTPSSVASSPFTTPVTDCSRSITSSERHFSHEEALASLEGYIEDDFIDMSDDDDDDEDQVTPVVEEEEVVLISAPPPLPSRRARKRGSAMESWFPLASFIDLKDDDMSSWNWRSFIEVGS